MPRRGPPSPLLLAQGPTPSRGAPKHTIPSVPRPTYCPPMTVGRGANTRPKASSLQVDVVMEELRNSQCIQSPVSSGASPRSTGTISESPSALRIRGPWDHSASIGISFDTRDLLAPLKPAIVL